MSATEKRLTYDELRPRLRAAGIPQDGWWRHMKTRGLYQVIGPCLREEDLVVCVMYRPEGCPDIVFTRPVEVFLAKFVEDGR